MEPTVINVSLVVLTLAVATIAVVLLLRYLGNRDLRRTHEDRQAMAEQWAQEAEKQKRELVLEAKDEAMKIRGEAEDELKERRAELARLEKRLVQKEETLDRKVDTYDRRDQELQTRDEKIRSREQEADKLQDRVRLELERVAGLPSEEAKKMLLSKLEGELVHESSVLIRDYENQLKENSQKLASKILSQAIQRTAVDHVVESTVSVVTLPNDEMKGRIIGREGRNIRALEAATGVDLIIDDTPEAVIISGFDPIRREIARLSLEKLISDGRIHPTRIEEVVERARRELDEKIREEGNLAILEVGVQSLHPELIKLLGRLRFRASYGQNVLQHSKEVAYISGLLAAELGVNVQVAKRAGLLHDIGKALTYEHEGSHLELGREVLKRYNENQKVIHAMECHHFDYQPETVEAVIVQVADSISAARPGARREQIESYIKRMQKLEEIAASFPGIEKSFAIQAGREVRVMVQPEVISDEEAPKLARDIAQKIESELEYPGQVKVTLIRETRISDYAK